MKKFFLPLIFGLIPVISSANCVFNSSDLNFGNYQSPYQSSDVLSSNNITVVCNLHIMKKQKEYLCEVAKPEAKQETTPEVKTENKAPAEIKKEETIVKETESKKSE